jgi:hypothetical protein
MQIGGEDISTIYPIYQSPKEWYIELSTMEK